jgi:hypothetical protein
VVRRLLQSLNGREPTVQALTEATVAIDRAKTPEVAPRVSKTDADIAGFIRGHLAQSPTCSKTVLLREFRGQGQACEQNRFGKIYTKVRMESKLNA